MKHEESKETPAQESMEHSKGFLKKASKLADKKLGKGKRKGKKSRSKVSRKRR